MSEQALVVLSTCPDPDTASRLARMLVEQRLAACVNLIPGLRSVYEWEGRIEEDAEVLLVIKTSRARYPELEARLTEAHPYEVPEILALDVTAGLPAYLAWLHDVVRSSP